MAMTKELIERSRKRHAFADLPLLVLTASLVLSLAVAFTAVSIGIARADTLVPFGGGGSGRLALAMLVGVVIAGMGGLTAALVHNDRLPSRLDPVCGKDDREIAGEKLRASDCATVERSRIRFTERRELL